MKRSLLIIAALSNLYFCGLSMKNGLGSRFETKTENLKVSSSQKNSQTMQPIQGAKLAKTTPRNIEQKSELKSEIEVGMTANQLMEFNENFSFMIRFAQYDPSQFKLFDQGADDKGDFWQRLHNEDGQELMIWNRPNGTSKAEVQLSKGEWIGFQYNKDGKIENSYYINGLYHKKMDFADDGTPKRVLTWKYTSEHSKVTIYEFKDRHWTRRLSSK